MTQEFFVNQIQRLRTRFGEPAFDQEFVKLVWREVHDMSEAGFARFVDVMIGSRSKGKAPLLSEFREARLNEEKLRFTNETRQAQGALAKRAPAEMRAHMRAVLSNAYGGAVDGVSDAVEIARLKARVDGQGPEGAA